MFYCSARFLFLIYMFQSKYYRRPPWNTHFLRIKALTILGVLVTFLLTFFFGLAALFVISVSIFFFFGLIAHLFVKSVLGRSNPEEVAMEKTWKFNTYERNQQRSLLTWFVLALIKKSSWFWIEISKMGLLASILFTHHRGLKLYALIGFIKSY